MHSLIQFENEMDEVFLQIFNANVQLSFAILHVIKKNVYLVIFSSLVNE